jgi:excinuclease ABC subunit C
MPNAELKSKVAAFPDAPGVYLMKDARGVVIYVGKAKSLRARVGAYFQDRPGDERPKIPFMMRQVADVECVVAESEVDALLMEARLIKDVQPRYNSTLRDSKLYPYVEITRGDDFPRVQITRQRDEPRSRYYGPFTDVTGLRQAAQMLQRVFRFRTCTLGIRADDAKRRFNRPCLLYSIRRCTAPCADRVTREEYGRQIELFQRFLEGKRRRVMALLEEDMRAQATALRFEQAAAVRDQMRALEALAKRGDRDFFPEAAAPPALDPRAGLAELRDALDLPAPPRTIEGVDVSHIGGDSAVASLVTFVDGKPFKGGYRRYRIQTVEGIDDFAMIAEVVGRRFRRLAEEDAPAPDLLLIDGGKGQLHAARERLRAQGAALPAIVAIAKREELLYTGDPAREVRLKRSSPALRILQYVRDEAHRFAVHYHHILRGKTLRAEV